MKVIFPRKKKQDSNLIDYPDDIKFFSNTKTVGTDIVAEYKGTLPLIKYVPETKVKPEKIDTKTLSDSDFKKIVLEKLGIECQ